MVLSLSAVALLAAGAATLEPPEFARLSATLDSLKWARISATSGVFEVERPTLADDGLHFRRVKGYPTPRPALITDPHWRPTPPPRAPIPFAEITRIERPVRRTSLIGLPIGVTLGFAAGVALGIPAAWIMGNTSDHQGLAFATLLGCGFLGTYVGGRFMGVSQEWQPVYPSP